MSDRPSDPDALVTAVHDFSEIRAKLAIERTRDRHILVRMNGSFVGQVFALDEGEYSIGRAPESRIWVHEEGVSRRHARIERTPEGFVVRDLGSANGTFVGGERVTRRLLADGDLLEIAGVALFRFSHTDAEHERMLVSLYEASVRDPLTGAFNRDHFAERLRAEISFARRHKTEVGLVMFDLDHFKRINDTYGHPAGDEVLVATIDAVRATLRLEDVLARYGGEEFAVILRNIPLQGVRTLAERLRQKVEGLRVRSERGSIRPTASFGCATLSSARELSSEALIEAADRCLLDAKRRGRNCVVG